MGVTNYIWDVVSDNVLMEKDDEGDTIATYTHEPGLHGEMISMHRDGQSYYYDYDGEGNTVAVTDENQNVVEEASYTAFGEVVEKTSSIVNPFGYKGALGYYTDAETGNVDVRRRIYEPQIGRWLSIDPAHFVDGPNVYAYCRNNPVNLVDTTGLSCECCCCARALDVKLIRRFYYGHQFHYFGSIAFVPGSSVDEEKPCTLEWWEHSDKAVGGVGLAPNTWQDENEVWGSRSPPIWKGRNDIWANKRSCPGLAHWQGVDEPEANIDTTGDRTLYIKVILRSAQDPVCEGYCSTDVVSFCVVQTLRLRNGVPDWTKSALKVVATDFRGECNFGAAEPPGFPE